MSRLASVSLIALLAAAGPALAQPAGQAASPTAPTPAPASPPATPAPPPATTNPPVVVATPPETPPVETPPVENQTVAAPPPRPAEPDTISLTEPYPNGLADPVNFASADNDRGGGGFPWGLLGLLGLLGLVPWLRGAPKTIYVEREKPSSQDPGRPRE